jgi:L-lactate dehydrogenase complex protein LldF
MTLAPTSNAFDANARAALADPVLQSALARFAPGITSHRRHALGRLPEFEALRDAAAAIRRRVLADLPAWLEAFETAAVAQGARVHWARDADEATRIIVDLAKAEGARTVTKAKSMVSEEIGLNAALEAAGVTPIETDLGEYIIQLAGEPPSHIIGPALHKTAGQVAELFQQHHGGPPREVDKPALVAEARAVLRERYFAADIGITGANMLIAETGGVVTVTNEGNADLTHSLPRLQVVVASIEKVVPTLAEAMTLVRVLARSATGQEISTFTSFVHGPRKPGETEGPEALHIVLVDNGRSALMGGPAEEVLACIRCGACMNHCPVYQAVGGHAYGWVYPGPIGAALDPALAGLEATKTLPDATPMCGRCADVCPVRIPLPKIFRHWREETVKAGLEPQRQRWMLALWRWFAVRPWLYAPVADAKVRIIRMLAGGKGSWTKAWTTGAWSKARDLPLPEGASFQGQWRQEGRPIRPGDLP